MKNWIKLFTLWLVAAVFTAGASLSPNVAHADGKWREGWCKKGEGLAIVVNFSYHKPMSKWKKIAPKGYIVRCIIGGNPKGDDVIFRGLETAGFTVTGTPGYIESIEGVYYWNRGNADRNTLRWTLDPFEFPQNESVDSFQWWSAPNTLPIVKPQYASSGGGNKPNPNPTVKPPTQTYTPKPNVKTKTAKPKPKPNKPGKTTKPAPKPVAPGATQARPVGTNQPTRPGSRPTSAPTNARTTVSPTQTSATPSPSVTGTPSATASASVTPSPSATAIPSEVFAEESPAATEEAGAPTDSQDSSSSSSGTLGWILGAVAVLAAIGGGIWYVASRKPTSSA